MISLKYKIDSNGKMLVTQFKVPKAYQQKNQYGEGYNNSCKLFEVKIKQAFKGFELDKDLAGDDEIELKILIHQPCDFDGSYKETKEIIVKNRFENYHYLYGQNLYLSKDYLPILHFCTIRFDDYREVDNRYTNVVDSSIWNFFVKYNVDNPSFFEDEDLKLLEKAIGYISYNYKKGLYGLSVAKEYADFDARKTKESYLIDFPGGKGHAESISPFVFHSESDMRKLIDEQFTFLVDKICKNKWRILLVDDKANTAMAPYKIPEDGRLDTKLKIIKSQLATIKTLQGTPPVIKHGPYKRDNSEYEDCDFLIEYAEDIKSAKAALQKREYDIILLDYLLDRGDGAKVEYGYYLLKEIENSINEYRIGPRDCFFFMFISAYPSAVNERLLAQGLNRSEDYWYIDTGACPTNTPQLFTYNLLQLMKKRLKDCGIWGLTSEGILELINNIFSNKLVRTCARDNYHEVLRLHYNFRKILQDVEVPEDYDEQHPEKIFNSKGSVLASHFMLKNHNLGGLLEHLVQLVHLAAFGTIRQWAEMWEEYIYIRAYFEERGFSVNDDIFKQMCEHIENYIFELKSQQR